MYHFHPWHHVSHGFNGSDAVQALIEIPKGSRAKYEIDKESGLMKLDRVLYSSVYYPTNYGFVPQSLGQDKDPLDILVLSQILLEPRCLVMARIIGVMRMIDNNEADDKLISVAEGDTSVNHINDISSLPEFFISELKNFFEEDKKLENKKVVVDDFLCKGDALKILIDSIQYYQQQFKPSSL
ncbi:MAG: inorganic diphosphatase [Bacteroidia bacterium]|nr:inorganic diphosphatase [Bacteroidia bacterium]